MGEIGSPAHQGGVYGVNFYRGYQINEKMVNKTLSYFKVAWKPDGTQLLTASGDKKCKLWDIETRSVVSEFYMGSTVEDQQVIMI